MCIYLHTYLMRQIKKMSYLQHENMWKYTQSSEILYFLIFDI